MSKLFKYEFRKNLFIKLIILGITAVLEVVFLIGVLGDFQDPMGIGAVGLFFTALAGIGFIGIESILILYRDLTTKQSYMLFMTPNSSYKILGAKALENGASILLSGLFFGGLAALDFWLLADHIGLKDFIDMFTQMVRSVDSRIELSPKSLSALLLLMLTSWVLRIITGYLAIVLSCTVLSGRKGAALIGFLFYIAISLLISWISSLLPSPEAVIPSLLMQSGILLVWSVLMYFATAWLMDKKLSV